MWNKQRTSEYQERTSEMDAINPGNHRTVLLEVEPSETEARASSRAQITHRHDPLARVLGLLLCLVGVCIIAGVIYLAYGLYTDPNLAKLPAAPPGQTGIPVADVGSIFMRLVFRVSLLGIMSISGSLIANKGIHMLLASLPSRGR
jgi:hypothetical protein